VLALLGPNGAGKTTTIEILEGFGMRSSGDVRALRLDPAARREFHDLVHRLTDVDDTTILLTTHDLDGAGGLFARGVPAARCGLERGLPLGVDSLLAPQLRMALNN
jgi:ABC-type multidrug transport system ATPase subunit